MDEEENPNAVSSTWPPPPPFWKSFTPENLSRIDELRKQKAEAEGINEDDYRCRAKILRVDDAPWELRHLQPPPEPENGAWRLFGATYRLVDDLPRLEDQGVRRLFPNPEERDQDGKHFDRATILKRLAKSLLLNFLELTGILATNPGAVRPFFLSLPLPPFRLSHSPLFPPLSPPITPLQRPFKHLPAFHLRCMVRVG